MKDKVVLVSGANRGIGYEVAKQLAEKQATVILGARDAQKGAEAVAQLKKRFLNVHLGILDTSSEESVTALKIKVEAQFGRLDVLVNNAGGNYDYDRTPTNSSPSFMMETFDLNCVGTLRMIQAFLPLLQRSDSARIVNVASGAGSFSDKGFGLLNGSPNVLSYSLSKLAINGLTVKLAAELKDTKIMVNSVCPGFTATYPGAREMGARPVEEGAASVAWGALIPDDGPRGGFFRDGKSIGW